MASLPASFTPNPERREPSPSSRTLVLEKDEGTELNLSVDASAVSRAFAYLGRPRALNPRTGRATTFRCVLPDHEDRRPSATIFRSKESGTWRYVCRGCGAWLSLARLYYSCVTCEVDRDNELPAPTAARWLTRLWHDAGVAPVELLDMPEPDGPREVRQVANGFRLLASIRVSLGDRDPVPFSAAFAAGWSGVPLEVAQAALKELRRQGWLRPRGKSRPRIGYLYELELSSDDAAVKSEIRAASLETSRPIVIVKPEAEVSDHGAVLAAHVVTQRGGTVTPVRRARPAQVTLAVSHEADFTSDCGVPTDANEAA